MRALAILGLSTGAAFVCACVFLCMLWFTLPPDDAAYHGPPFAALIDPFFLSGAIWMALLIGIVSFPFLLHSSRPSAPHHGHVYLWNRSGRNRDRHAV
jgi:hypothetical protein